MAIILGDQYLTLSTGTTAQRPTAANGLVRYNSTTGYMEMYDESDWRKIIKGYHGEYAYRGGPTSYNAAYKSNYYTGYHSNGDVFDATSNGAGITINKSGYYYCVGTQRFVSGDGFAGIALNGDRPSLDSTTNDGYWGHDHTGGTDDASYAMDYSWSQCFYVGYLAAGNFITHGAASSQSSTFYNTAPYAGALLIIKLK